MNAEELANRFVDFAAKIIRTCGALCSDYTGKHIYGQLMRSATSAGANYEEARGAESKADFSHKLQIVLKELRESRFWIRLIIRAGLIPKDQILPILSETDELIRIIAKSVVTSKTKKQFAI